MDNRVTIEAYAKSLQEIVDDMTELRGKAEEMRDNALLLSDYVESIKNMTENDRAIIKQNLYEVYSTLKDLHEQIHQALAELKLIEDSQEKQLSNGFDKLNGYNEKYENYAIKLGACENNVETYIDDIALLLPNDIAELENEIGSLASRFDEQIKDFIEEFKQCKSVMSNLKVFLSDKQHDSESKAIYNLTESILKQIDLLEDFVSEIKKYKDSQKSDQDVARVKKVFVLINAHFEVSHKAIYSALDSLEAKMSDDLKEAYDKLEADYKSARNSIFEIKEYYDRITNPLKKKDKELGDYRKIIMEAKSVIANDIFLLNKSVGIKLQLVKEPTWEEVIELSGKITAFAGFEEINEIIKGLLGEISEYPGDAANLEKTLEYLKNANNLEKSLLYLINSYVHTYNSYVKDMKYVESFKGLNSKAFEYQKNVYTRLAIDILQLRKKVGRKIITTKKWTTEEIDELREETARFDKYRQNEELRKEINALEIMRWPDRASKFVVKPAASRYELYPKDNKNLHRKLCNNNIMKMYLQKLKEQGGINFNKGTRL